MSSYHSAEASAQAKYPEELKPQPQTGEHHKWSESEINELHKTYSAFIRASVGKILGYKYKADIDDAWQNAWINATNALLKGSYRGEKSNIGAWLTVIAKNSALQIIRQKVSDERIFPVKNPGTSQAGTVIDERIALESNYPDWALNPEEALLNKEKGEITKQIIASLPEKFRAALISAYVLKLEEKAAADKLGISIGAYKSRLFRARNLFEKKYAQLTESVQDQNKRQKPDV